MPTYSAGSAAIDIKPSLANFVKELRTDLERIQVEYTVDVDADLSKLHRQLDTIRDRTVNVDVDVDTDGATARLARLARDRTVNIDVDDHGGLARTTAAAGAAEGSLSAMSAVKFGSLASGIAALIPVLLGAAGAAGGMVAALGAIGATGLVGSGGIIGAFKSMGDDAEGAGKAADDLADKQHNVEKAARDVADAQRDLADAQKDAKKAQDDLAKSYEEGRRALRDMNDELTDSVLAQEDAEIALARAQTQRMKVYRDRTSTRLDKRQADNDVRKADQRLKEAKSEHADKATDTAEANQKGIGGSKPVVAAKEKADDANKKVIDQQEKLADALYNLAKAQEDLAKGSSGGGVDKFNEALAKLSPNARDFVLQIKALGPAFADLKLAVQDRLFDGLGASVTQFAQQNLPGMKSMMTDVAGYMNGAFKDTLTNLSGQFRQLSADGRMDGLRQAAQSMLSGVAPLIGGVTNGLITMASQIAPTLGPLLTSLGDLFVQVGPSLGIVGAALADTLSALMPQLGSFINALSEGLAPVLPVLGKLIGALGDALQPLIPPLSTVLQVLGNALAEALPIVAPFFAELVGLVGDLLQAVAPLLPPLLQLLSAILTPLAGLLRTIVQNGLIPFAQTLATALQPAIEKLTPIMQQVMDKIGKAFVDALNKLMPYLPQLVNSMVNLGVALLPILPPLVDIAVKLLPMMAETLVHLLPYLIKMIDQFAGFATQSAPGVARALETVSTALSKVGDLVKWVGEQLGKMLDWVKALPANITSAASGMWDGIKNAFKAMLNWIFKAWNDMSLTLTIPVVNKTVTIDTPDIPLLKADGGPISGPGTATSDSIPTMLSNGEYVIKAASVQKYGVGFFDTVNAGHYADGGLVAAKSFAQSMAGTPYYMGGFSKENIDCSGLVSAVVNAYRGEDPFVGRMATPTEGPWLTQRGFKDGKGGANDITIGWYDEGGGENGHTAGNLGSIPFESHGPTGAPAEYGTGTGANKSYFTNWMHLPMQNPIVDPKNPNANAQPGSFDPNSIDSRDGRDDPQKYAPDPVKRDYPTSLSGWAGFVAKGFAEGYTKDTLDTLHVSDTPSWLTGASTLDQNIEVHTLGGKHLFGSYGGGKNNPLNTSPPLDRTLSHQGSPGGKKNTGLPPGVKPDDWSKKYDTGGWLQPGITVAHNETGKPEAILTAEQWTTAERAMRALPPQHAVPSRSGGGQGAHYGDNVTNNISTARVEDAFMMQRERDDRRAAAAVSRWN